MVCLLLQITYRVPLLLQKTNLISDQGGQLGLWLGLSLLTMFEMVELLWDLLVSVFRVGNKPAPTNAGSTTPCSEKSIT